jgi:hypothetical protein
VTSEFFPCREEKRLRRKEDTLLRELRIFLRDIWAKINRESKFFMFRLVIDGVPIPHEREYVHRVLTPPPPSLSAAKG